MPRSASSVTLCGSQPPMRSSARRRKWLEVPPSGSGTPRLASTGNSKSNSMAYSAANWRGSQFSARVVKGKAGLQAGDLGGSGGKQRGGMQQLPRLGDILGIEDGDEIAAREGEPIIERLGLGLRPQARHGQHLEGGPEV